jgi:PPM family protein phosphatase
MYDPAHSAGTFEVVSDGRTETLAAPGQAPDDGMIAAVVADGLGGQAAGEVASYWAVREFLSSLLVDLSASVDTVEAIRNAYGRAESGVRAHAPSDAATTMTVALTMNGKLFIGNIGDSRSYVISSGSLIIRTKDHSFVQSLVDAGAIDEVEALRHPRRNIITRALGSDPKEPDVYSPGELWDKVLLCSDGVCGVMTDDEIARLVMAGNDARSIVGTSLEKGSQDNSTAIIISKV